MFTVAAADNEPVGTWTVAVRELAFGTPGERAVTIE
jgi:hypothetical protein